MYDDTNEWRDRHPAASAGWRLPRALSLLTQ